METRDKILKYIKKNGASSGTELAKYLGISRQALNKHIKKLIRARHILKEGATKDTLYKVFPVGQQIKENQKFRKTYFLKGLEEHKVFKEVEFFLDLKKHVKKNVIDIIRYAFTEILNNAIEHSRGEKCFVETFMDQYNFDFKIRDFGIGIFYSVFEKFKLPDEYSAIREIIKGKTTTMQEKHAGKGVFFVSKSGDVISFKSHKVNLLFDNQKKDIYVEEKRFTKGTDVNFKISRNSRRKLGKIFDEFAPKEFEYKFERTRVQIKLFQKEYFSRSEARRLLYGLEKFKEIVLDFKGVNAIAHSFADEIFRVFKGEHPEVKIEAENLKPVVKSMIKHVS